MELAQKEAPVAAFDDCAAVDVFFAASQARQWSMGDPLAVPHGEVLATMACMNARLSVAELAIVRAMDAAWLRGCREEQADMAKREGG